MADKKISALTAASTPLAGTEILPIVQSGSTVNVSVNNLTTGKDVTVKGLTATSTTDNNVTVQSTGTSNAASVIIKSGNGTTSGLYSYIRMINDNTAGQDWRLGLYGDSDIQLVNATGSKNLMRWGTGGDVTVPVGNLIIGTAGKGIAVGTTSLQSNYLGTFGNSTTAANIYLASSGSGSYITGVSSSAPSAGFQTGHLTSVSKYQVQVGGTGGVEVSSGGTSWASMSDERLKDIIEPIEQAIEKVNTLRAVIGKYKTDEEGTRRSFLIAQDVEQVLPEAVGKTTLAKEKTEEFLTVAYTEVIPLLVAAVKELSAEIKAIKGV